MSDAETKVIAHLRHYDEKLGNQNKISYVITIAKLIGLLMCLILRPKIQRGCSNALIQVCEHSASRTCT